MDPWTLKHKPENPSRIQGQDKPVKEMIDFIKGYQSGKKRAMFLYGSPGTGKTCSVYAAAEELGMELIEINASDYRGKDEIASKVGSAINQYSLFGKGKIILIDEVDGISGTHDRGGLQVLSSLIAKSRFPVILTANDPWDKKFADLRKLSEMVEFNTLAYTSVRAVLKRICDAEGITYDENAITMLSRYADGDLRAGITDLQVLTQSTLSLTSKDLSDVFDREKVSSMVDALMKIFKSANPDLLLPSLDNVEEDVDEIFFWIDENLPHEYQKIADLARAYDNVSLADVFKGRINRWQHWRFIVYIKLLLSAGVGLSKQEKYPGFTKYRKTTRILGIWQANIKNTRKNSIAQKIADKTHTSKKRVLKDTLPYLRSIFKSNPGKAEEMAKELDLEKEEIDYLSR